LLLPNLESSSTSVIRSASKCARDLWLKPQSTKLTSEIHEMSFGQLLDSDEAAALLKIRPKTLQKMVRNGEITGVQVGRLWRFRASVLNDWLERKRESVAHSTSSIMNQDQSSYCHVRSDGMGYQFRPSK
jgi:excisionase family DNA binding protein